MVTAGCKDNDAPGMKVTCHSVYMLPEKGGKKLERRVNKGVKDKRMSGITLNT